MSRSRSKAVPPHDGHAEPFGQELLDRPLVPGVRAVRVEDGRGFINERRRENRFAARHAVERRNRHTPRALARDAPVRAIGHHIEDAVAAPRRNPFHLVIDGMLRRFAQRPRRPVLAPDGRVAVHPDEPLGGREEDHRVVAAPAVRVLVRNASRCQKRPRSSSACSTLGLASNTRCPPKRPTVSRKCPSASTGA